MCGPEFEAVREACRGVFAGEAGSRFPYAPVVFLKVPCVACVDGVDACMSAFMLKKRSMWRHGRVLFCPVSIFFVKRVAFFEHCFTLIVPTASKFCSCFTYFCSHRLVSSRLLLFSAKKYPKKYQDGTSWSRYLTSRLIPSHKDPVEEQVRGFPNLAGVPEAEVEQLRAKLPPTDDESYREFFWDVCDPNFQ